jgi:general secretion pathway protein N
MTIYGMTVWLVLALSGEAAAHSRLELTQAALDTNTLQGGIGSPEPMPGAVVPIDPSPGDVRPPSPARPARELRGNPLWGIGLKSLSATRERPIFLPSRRPPAPAVAGPPPVEPVRPPPPPAEPDRPRLALVGAVAGDKEGIAIFLDERTRDIVRLRTGENHLGWILRSVRGREATLQKDRETVLLALPAPTDPQFPAPPGPGMPRLPGMPEVIPIPGMPRMPSGKEPEL